MGGSAGKSAAEAQAVLHSMLLPDLYHSPRSLTNLFYWYREFTFINEPQTHISSKQEKRSHWEVTKWKGYGESEAGTGKEGKAALGAHHPIASGKAAESLGIKMRGQALNKVKVSRWCWCGVVPDTKPSVQINTQTHYQSSWDFLCSQVLQGRQAACKRRALKFFDRRSDSSSKQCSVPLTYLVWPYLPWLLQISTSWQKSYLLSLKGSPKAGDPSSPLK